MTQAVQITYEGLRETLQALAVLDRELLDSLVTGLHHGGEIIEHDATRRFVAYGSGKPSFIESAHTFETRVRAGGQAQALVVVGQRRRSSRDQLRRRPGYGGLQVKHALLPARAAKLDEAAMVLEHEVYKDLKRHGF